MYADPVFRIKRGGWGLVEIQVMYKMHAYQYRVTHLLIFQNSLQMAAIYAYASL